MPIYDSAHYQIDLEHFGKHILLKQHIKHPIIHTRQLPSTLNVLAKHVPSIFTNLCFNDKKQSFVREAKRTEIGHLFEHLVLEFMKLQAEKEGISATFDGTTSWNWSKYGKGTFHIKLTYKSNHHKFLNTALKKAIYILNQIYATTDALGGAVYPTPVLRKNASSYLIA